MPDFVISIVIFVLITGFCAFVSGFRIRRGRVTLFASPLAGLYIQSARRPVSERQATRRIRLAMAMTYTYYLYLAIRLEVIVAN